MNSQIEIRPAGIGDIEQIVRLIRELGYEIAPASLRQKIDGMASSHADHALVAVAGDHVLGCISLHVMPLFHAEGNLGRITALVVDMDHRGQGIGRALMRSSHEWFGAAHCARFEVTSGDHREGAHRFYEQQGYARQGQRLLKQALPE